MRGMCGVELNDRRRYTYFIFMLDWNKTMDQLAMTNSVCWYGHWLSREDGHVLRMALGLEVEGQIRNGRSRLRKKV